MQMKLEKQHMFATPKSVEDIHAWIELHSPEEKVHLYVLFGMTCNYVLKELEADDKQKSISRVNERNS